MSLIKKLDSWITWGVVGAIIGFALGVNTASVSLVAVGLGGFLVYLNVHGPAKHETEGSLFAAGGDYVDDRAGARQCLNSCGFRGY